MRGELVKSFQYFSENMQIRKKMNPSEDTIEYAEALNYLALCDIDRSNYEEAINKIKFALEIAEKKYGENSIELIKYLNNLSVAYY